MTTKKYTIAQLKKMCKEKGIKGYSKINKKNKKEFIKKCLSFEKPKLPKRKKKTRQKIKISESSIKKTPVKKTPKTKTPKSKTPPKINKNSVEYFNNFYNNYLDEENIFEREIIQELYKLPIQKTQLKKHRKKLFKKFNNKKKMKLRSYILLFKNEYNPRDYIGQEVDTSDTMFDYVYYEKVIDSSDIMTIFKGFGEFMDFMSIKSNRDRFFIGTINYNVNKKVYDISFES